FELPCAANPPPILPNHLLNHLSTMIIADSSGPKRTMNTRFSYNLGCYGTGAKPKTADSLSAIKLFYPADKQGDIY
ncbi:MAG: hypothetical protein WBJ41_01365, partial [Chromatiaceae bacterium]